MLYEILHVRQDDPRYRFRWFTAESGNSDLYLWENPHTGEIVRFQFCFFDQVVEWRGGDRLWFGMVEDEHDRGPKASAMIVKSEEVDLEEALAIFRYKGQEIDPSIRHCVESRLSQKVAQLAG